LIIVYTCCTNGRDAVREDQCEDGVSFEAFVDTGRDRDSIWTLRPATTLFRSPRRNARMHKILSHQFLDADYTIWMDANVALRVPAQRLVDEYLQDVDLAVFRHRTRSCTYDEAARCRELHLDSVEVIDRQVERYTKAGFPVGLGLPETSVLIRRHTADVARFNDAWWSELCRHSVRDQIGFMYAAERTGLKVNFFSPTKYQHPYFSMTVRPAGLERLDQSRAIKC
jgi:hypothetical protein